MFSTDWKLDDINKFTRTIGFNELEFEIKKIYEGKQTGRVIVSID